MGCCRLWRRDGDGAAWHAAGHLSRTGHAGRSDGADAQRLVRARTPRRIPGHPGRRPGGPGVGARYRPARVLHGLEVRLGGPAGREP
ncbi:hypothetical protein G6F31_020529 [Rhizopus arrhizus]|nr:hypothetical protein G6F31_020529 [Rhizopus arrhizus]